METLNALKLSFSNSRIIDDNREFYYLKEGGSFVRVCHSRTVSLASESRGGVKISTAK